VEVCVRSSEGGVAPICLHQPSPSRPIIRIPHAGVDSHGLVVQIRHSHCFIVLIHCVHIEYDVMRVLLCSIFNLIKDP